jgi:DNA-binding transcriptional LysR family regulator
MSGRRRSRLQNTAYLYFDAVARYGSLRRAAEELSIAASAISHQIGLLEEEFGTPLFERGARGVRLTSAGEGLLYYTRRAAFEIERGQAFVEGLRGRAIGSTSLVATEGIVLGPLVGRLKSFWKDYPDIRLTIMTGAHDQALNLLETGEVELGIGYVDPLPGRAKALAVAQLRVGAIIRADHQLAARKSTSIRELIESGLTLLMTDSSASLGPIIERAVGEQQLRLSRRLKTNSLTALNRLAMNGCGAAIKTKVGIDAELKAGTLAFIPLRDLGATRANLTLFARRDLPLTPAGEIFANTLKEMVHLLDEKPGRSKI